MHLSGPQFLQSQSREDKAIHSWRYTEDGTRLGWGSLIVFASCAGGPDLNPQRHVKLSAVVHSGNPRTKEVETGGSEAQGHPLLG